MRKKYPGYTLVEIFIIVGIISMLIVIGVVIYKKQLLKGYDGRRKADLYAIKVAVEEYEKDNNCYPTTLPSCKPGDGLRPYIGIIPCDPQTKENYYYYAEGICPNWFYIFSKLGNEDDSDSRKLGCLLGCGPNQQTSSYHYYVSSPNAPDPYSNTTPVENPENPEEPDRDYYGCFSGVCREIQWDYDKGAPSCDPNHTESNCNGVCVDLEGQPQNECI